MSENFRAVAGCGRRDERKGACTVMRSEERRMPAPQTPCEDEAAVMETAMKAGRLLLENGAEIFRVEETMERICRYYHAE